MKRLSDKYLAGFLDADGGIQLQWYPPVRSENWTDKSMMRCYAHVRFDQADQGFIELVAQSLTPPRAADIWGRVERDEKCWYWRLTGKRAVAVLQRLKNYSVNYRRLAETAIEMNGQLMHREVGRARFETARNAIEPMPKHPTRKWAAGYIDGNGHLGVRRPSARTIAQVVLEVSDEARDRTGVDLLAKQYGGSVQEWCTPAGTSMVKWVLTMPPSKIVALFSSQGKQAALAKNLVVKKDLAYFLLGCAKSKDFHDRDTIACLAKELRTQPHRLTDPSAAVCRALDAVANRA